MPRKNKSSKRKKSTPGRKLLLLLGVPILIGIVAFIAIDNLTLYWFILFNNDDVAEARRKEDFHWYESGGIIQGDEDEGSPGRPPEQGTGPGSDLVHNFANMTPEDAMLAVSRTLSEDVMQEWETMWRFFIYMMDRNGFVPNATIGAMSYMMAEGGADNGMNTFTYESYWCCAGPDGNKYCKLLDNQAWLTWLDTGVYTRAKELYDGMRANGNNVAHAAVGLGLTQTSDVWSGPGVKSSTGATWLVESAIDKSTYWQDPGFQIPFVVREYFLKEDGTFNAYRWDVNHCPGVNPQTDSNVTATEYANRVLCGVGMPGWRSDTCATNHPKSYASHTANVERASEIYYKYHLKDEWFYGSYYGDKAWLDPFTGPSYDNTTPQGVLLARMCVLFAGNNIADGEPKIYRTADHGYNAEDLVGAPSLRYYREGQYSIDPSNRYYASCDYAASAMIRLSGIDDEFLRVNSTNQRVEYADKSARWKYMGKVKDVALQPGDVLFVESGHISIWVGENIAGERWPGTTANIFQASLSDIGSKSAYFPDMQRANPGGDYLGSQYVYRCVDPMYSSVYWDQFIAHAGEMFPELPKTYSGKPAVTSNIDPSTWYWPLPGHYQITSRSGKRENPFESGKSEEHHGVDFRAVEGTKIYAAKSGTVVRAQDVLEWKEGVLDSSYGRMYIIRSDDKSTDILYAHMSDKYDLLLKVGDHVNAGQLIGYTGNTGRSKGAHFHFEIRGYKAGYSSNYYDCVDVYSWLEFIDPDGSVAVPKSITIS